MYDEINRELSSRQNEAPRKRVPLWGKAIKALLEEKKGLGEEMTVQSLAKRTGMNDKHLFNILAQRVQDPSSDKLVKIADALGISFAELAQRALGEWPGNFHVCGFGQRAVIEYGQHGFTIQSFSPPGVSGRDFFMGLMIIKPFRDLKKWKFRENSMICLFLESGTLEINYGGKARTIHANESVYFDGGVPHKFRNVDSVEARLFIATRPPLY